MHAVVYFACADNCIGRFDRSTLPQQTLMELFIFGLDGVNKICGCRNNPVEVCEWGDVICSADGKVRDSGSKSLQGTLSVECLPSSTKKIDMLWNSLIGTIKLAELPGRMENLRIHRNRLTANPTKGHLSVVGWTSTPVLGEAKKLLKPLVVFQSWRRPY